MARVCGCKTRNMLGGNRFWRPCRSNGRHRYECGNAQRLFANTRPRANTPWLQILRKDFQFCDKHLAPKAAISIFWRNHVLKHPTATTFYFAFDSRYQTHVFNVACSHLYYYCGLCSSRIPDERVRFLSEERYAAPITTPVYTGVTLDMMPAPWKVR